MKHIIDINDGVVNCKITIRLDDECNNGHEDFSITGTFWKKGKVRSEENMITAGACHDYILKHLPHLNIFIKLHLSDFRGYPMYYIKNGFYHLKHSKKEDFKRWYLITEQGYKLLSMADTEDEFAWLMIVFLKNNKKWENLAKEGIKELEKLTGEKFVPKSTRLQEVKYLDGNGVDNYNIQHFDTNKVLQRREEKKKQEIQSKQNEITSYYEEKINLLNIEKDLKLQILGLGFSDLSNVIFYPNCKLVLNYSKRFSNYDYIFTKSDYEKIKENIKLPQGVSIEFNEIKR